MDGIQEAQAIQDRVAAGAAWLDDRKPEWWKLIEPARIDITNCDECVLGQVFADEGQQHDGRSGFGYVLDEVMCDGFGLPEISFVIHHGFGPGGYDSENRVSPAALEDEWRRVIVERSA